MSTVSVVVPSLNDALMLRQCLAALAVQTRAPDEVIVVDNGSVDDTAEVARAAGARVVTEPVRGVLRATAAGFDAAAGDIIARLDTDSVPAPDWVARVEGRFDDDPTLTVLTGTGAFYGRGPGWRFVGRYLYLGGYFWLMRLLTGHTPVFGSNFALRREAWLAIRDRVHRDDPRAHDDLHISFALEPDMAVEFDRGLRVRVSARPFADFAGFRRRAAWGFHGIAVGLSDAGWWRRQRMSAAARIRRRAAR